MNCPSPHDASLKNEWSRLDQAKRSSGNGDTLLKQRLPELRRYAPRSGLLVLLALVLMLIAHDALADDWFDTFYQYRIPLETRSQQVGWLEIPISESQIVEAINRVDRFQFDPNFFSWNAARLVEVDEEGDVVDPHAEAGFYLMQLGDELAGGVLASGTEKPVISVSSNKPHLLTYTSSGVGKGRRLSTRRSFRRAVGCGAMTIASPGSRRFSRWTRPRTKSSSCRTAMRCNWPSVDGGRWTVDWQIARFVRASGQSRLVGESQQAGQKTMDAVLPANVQPPFADPAEATR